MHVFEGFVGAGAVFWLLIILAEYLCHMFYLYPVVWDDYDNTSLCVELLWINIIMCNCSFRNSQNIFTFFIIYNVPFLNDGFKSRLEGFAVL